MKYISMNYFKLSKDILINAPKRISNKKPNEQSNQVNNDSHINVNSQSNQLNNDKSKLQVDFFRN